MVSNQFRELVLYEGAVDWLAAESGEPESGLLVVAFHDVPTGAFWEKKLIGRGGQSV